MSNTLKCGNCADLIKEVPDKSIDLVVIDPPYLFEKSGGGGSFGQRNREYHKMVSLNKDINNGVSNELLDDIARVMKQINIYIWCNKKQLRQYIDYFDDLGCTTELLTWHKTNPVPTCDNKYLSDTEYLLFFRESGVKIYGTYESKKKYYITPTNKADKEKYGHPTIKPLNIIENIIINSSKENDTILDCFMGSGTTGVACAKHNRNFIGFEINEVYFNTAVNRINDIEIKDVKDTNQLTLF